MENNPEILTVHNVVKKLAQWSDKWISIAEGLKVPSAVISTIRVITTHQQSKDAALYRVVEWWFANSPNPEWSTIDIMIVDLGMFSKYVLKFLFNGQIARYITRNTYVHTVGGGASLIYARIAKAIASQPTVYKITAFGTCPNVLWTHATIYGHVIKTKPTEHFRGVWSKISSRTIYQCGSTTTTVW